jgi:hypothetical protein
VNRISHAAALALLVCLLAALPAGAQAVAPVKMRTTVQGVPGATGGTPTIASASISQCVTTEGERSVTFVGQMTMVAAASRMQIRTYLVQRRAGEQQFHMVSAPGLGTWVEADPGVKTYRELRQVTNLAAPAAYRAVFDFRWLGAHGRVVKRQQLTTSGCWQPAPAPATGS